MSRSDVDHVRAFLLDHVRGNLQAASVTLGDVDDRTNLFAAGIVDSFGVLELITVVSDRFDVEGDWEDYEPEEILVVGPFCRYVADRARSDAAD